MNPVLVEWNSKAALLKWRESWAALCNESLKRNGIDQTISPLSYEERGIHKVAMVHVGVDAAHAEKRGIQTELGELNRQIQRDNTFLENFEKQIQVLEQKETERLNKTAVRLENLRSRHIMAAYQQFCISISLAEEQESMAAQMRAATAMAESAEHIIRAVETLSKSLIIYRKQQEETNLFQRQKWKDLEEKIIETEGQIQNLKRKLDELQEQREQIKIIPTLSPEKVEQKKKQIEYLKEVQSQAYREFYTLVKENKENMNWLRELIQGKRKIYDSQLEQTLKQHYADNFQDKILGQAKAKAPDIPAENAARIQKSISYKR